MDAAAHLLARIPLFEGLDEAALEALAQRGQERTCTEGSPLTTAGSRAAGFFVILEGTATVRVKGEAQRQLKRGDYFGELALIDGGRRTADVTADEHMRTFGLAPREFRTFVEEHPDVAWSLLERLVALLRAAEARAPGAAPKRRGLRRA